MTKTGKFYILAKYAIKATLAQAIGRIANIFIPLVILYIYEPDGTTDNFFLAFSIAFLFWGTIANSITDSTVPKLLQNNDLLEQEKRYILSTIIATIALLVLLIWNVIQPSPNFSFVILSGVFVSTFACVFSAFLVSVLHIKNNYSLPGFLWGIRIIPLLIYWYISPDIVYLPFLMLGIGLGDLLRMKILSNQAQTEDVSPVGWSTLSGYTAVAFAAIISGLNPIIDRVIANYGNVGDLTLLELGERLYGVVATLSTIGIMNVVLVELSGRIKDKGFSVYWNKMLFIFIFWSLIWVVMVFLFWPIIEQLVFPAMQISEKQFANVELIFFYYLSGLPAFIIGLICVRGFLSLGMLKELTSLALVSLGLNLVLSYYFHLLLGVSGIALATSLVYAFITVFMLMLLSAKKHVK